MNAGEAMEAGRERKPSGFVARCPCGCGAATGAMDYERTPNPGKLLGAWLMAGSVVEPRFGGTWSESLEPCRSPSTGGKG